MSAFQDGVVVAARVEDCEYNRLGVDDLVKNSMREPPKVCSAPIAEPDAVAKGVFGDDVDDPLHLVHEGCSEAWFLRIVPAGVEFDIRLCQREPSGRV